MRNSIIYVLLCVLAVSGTNCRLVFARLFHGLKYPSHDRQQYYPGNYDFRRPAPVRPQKPVRSYKDICRLVNHNGFLNAGGVPKCPY
ncbi:uncharacterized protein LOC122817776 [Drosophila biarmipes]|uniref:uncharacterized protein LOC122817776 n=1 Tax=Drosophila biarmipes TaxID=125945 RepID=UPI001CDB09EF|nr:uncharacterized protein LOC122817776 [Drosophila biarmipes]